MKTKLIAAAMAALDAQFRVDRATIMEYYTQAVFDNDTETQEELKTEMERVRPKHVRCMCQSHSPNQKSRLGATPPKNRAMRKLNKRGEGNASLV